VLLEGVLHGASAVVLAEVEGRIREDAVQAIWLEGGEEVEAVGLVQYSGVCRELGANAGHGRHLGAARRDANTVTLVKCVVSPTIGGKGTMRDGWLTSKGEFELGFVLWVHRD
jgi:hypothetical protein